jgi:type 1 glutamine amidotransferase
MSRATVLIAGDDVYEDLLNAASELTAIATDAGFVARSRLGLGGLVALADDDELPELLVLYTAMGESTEAQHRVLSDAVDDGMGILAIHSSVVMPAEAERLRALLGSRYRSHGPRPHESRFEVRFDGEHPITTGLDALEVEHEHYEIELAPDAKRVIAWRETATGREPLLHVREQGLGRVCYLQLGHDMRLWRDPSARRLVARAMVWAGGDERVSETKRGGGRRCERSSEE